MYSESFFLYEVGLTEVKENDFKDIAHDKRQKTSSKKKEVNEQALQKMTKIIF